jgi:hypothetical protein
MANYYATSRTNYVEVIDPVAFADMAKRNHLEMLIEGDKCGLAPNVNSDGCWPSEFVGFSSEIGEGEDEPADVEFTFEEHVMPLVKEGQVLVTISAGAEKLRYVSGYATAFIRQGDDVKGVSVSLNEIYGKAALAFGVPVTAITAAEY